MASDIQYSPKLEFQQRHKADAEELQKHRLDGWLHTAITHTIAQMAFNGASAEKLSGAKEFIFEFQNLFEKSEGPKPLPSKPLGVYPPELQETKTSAKSKK